jgi:hypothetical protein
MYSLALYIYIYIYILIIYIQGHVGNKVSNNLYFRIWPTNKYSAHGPQPCTTAQAEARASCCYHTR